MIYIYDIECYMNFFCVTFKCIETQEITSYTIFDEVNDIDKLYTFICNSKTNWLVGYNSYSYDNQLLAYLHSIYDSICFCTSQEITSLLFERSNEIINGNPTRFYTLPFRYIDLMKVGNTMNKSLKLLAVNLNWDKIQDLPIKCDQWISPDQVDLILEYNLNDVLITEQLYYKLRDAISLRWEITDKYKISVISESKSGMANRLLEKMYSERTGITIPELKKLRSPREIIHFENVIFENIKFETKELKQILNELYGMKYYRHQPFIKKNIVFNEVGYQLGIGGIHSEDTPGIFESSDEIDIIDADIASFYPSLIINHELKPAHLTSAFLDIYKEIRDRRVKAKHEGQKTEAEVLKIAINSVFGKTLAETHWLYDPLVGLRTTINGQLYILMLIEKLTIAGFKVISANTDGIVTIVPKKDRETYNNCCKQWEEDTRFELEFTEYKRYIRRDVNNYITVKKDNKTKTKGIFSPEISLEQGVDKPILSKALYNYFTVGKPVADTITETKDILDFAVAKRTDDKFVNEYHTIVDRTKVVIPLQKTIRFYMSTRGGALYKKDQKTGKLISYCTDSIVNILNENTKNSIDTYNVNYQYYIKECNKIINLIECKQLTLF